MHEEKINRLQSWRGGKPQGPVVLELNPTNRCNLKCLSCWQRAFPVDIRNELKPEKFFSIIDQAADLGVKEVRIPGAGEPLVRKDLFELMFRIKEKNMRGLLITNGTLFTERSIRKLIDLGWDCITFSIDGPDAKTNDYLRGVKGSFSKTLNAIKSFNKLKKEVGSNVPIIRINSVLSNRNFDKLEEMAKLFSELGCQDWQLQSMTVWGDEGEKLKLGVSQKKAVQTNLKQAKAAMDKVNIYNNLSAFIDDDLISDSEQSMDTRIAKKTKTIKDPFLSLPCFEPWYNMIILPDGKAAQCSISGGKDGDNVSEKSLEDVWYGDAFNMIRERLLKKNLLNYCKRCCANVHVESEKIRQYLWK